MAPVDPAVDPAKLAAMTVADRRGDERTPTPTPCAFEEVRDVSQLIDPRLLANLSRRALLGTSMGPEAIAAAELQRRGRRRRTPRSVARPDRTIAEQRQPAQAPVHRPPRLLEQRVADRQPYRRGGAVSRWNPVEHAEELMIKRARRTDAPPPPGGRRVPSRNLRVAIHALNRAFDGDGHRARPGGMRECVSALSD